MYSRLGNKGLIAVLAQSRLHLRRSPSSRVTTTVGIFAAGHQPAADHILDPFEIFGSMVGWFHGSMVICDCSAVQSAVCLVAAPVFLLIIIIIIITLFV